MNISPVRLTLCLGAAFAFGVVSGRFFKSSADLDGGSAAAAAGVSEASASGRNGPVTAGKTAPSAPPYHSATRHLADGEWLAASQAAPEVRRAALLQKSIDVLAAVSDYDRLRQFSALMEFLQPGDFETVLEAFKHHDRAGRSSFHDEFRMLAVRAVTLGDTAPVEKLIGDFSKDQTIHLWFPPVIKEWASHHSGDAAAWWNALPDGPLREGIAEPLIGGLAQSDPETGWKYAEVFPPEQRQVFAGRFFDNALMTGGFDSALSWLQSVDGLGLPDAEAVKREGAEKLRGSLWALSAAEASAALTPLAREPWAETALVHHVEKRAGEEPEQVADWLEGLGGTPHYENLRARLLDKWSASDAGAAEAWNLKTRPR